MADKPKTEKEKRLHTELIKQLITLSTSGFGVVAALAWNSLIQEFVNEYVKRFLPGSGMFSLLIYALLVTALAVTVTYQLTKLLDRLKQ